MPGKLGAGGLGKLGWGLVTGRVDHPSPFPPPLIEYGLIVEDGSGFILAEDGNTVTTEA